MPVVEKSIEVRKPLTMVYNQWTQFEDFPHFMEGVKSVKQIDNTTVHWLVNIGGVEREFTAKILEQTPDKKIVWRSTEGPLNAGTVLFYPIDDHRTRVSLAMEYDPEGVVETTGNVLGIVSRRVEGDLERFKKFIESRDMETGAWRGKVA